MKVFIGIDIGVNTGVAISEGGKLVSVKSYGILDAMELCLSYKDKSPVLYIEDPTKGMWVAKATKKQIGRLQGAGSIKRDFQIWVDFVKKHGFKFVFSSHLKTMKLNAEEFKIITKWRGQTNQHSRDAAMLIFGR